VLRTRSIRARLLAGILVALVAILGASAWLSYEVTTHEAEELFGARLATSARVLDALVARQARHATISHALVIELPAELEHADDAGSALGHPYETKIAFQVWRDDGALLARSASAPARPFGPNVPGFGARRVGGELYHVFVLRSGGAWIQVAEKNEVRDELVQDLGFAVMTPLVAGAVLLLVLVNLVVVYGLAPLRQLAAQIARRAPDSLAAVQLHDVPDEVAPVVRALNELLARVKRAFEHERRFTDAAAHELRTPIAALKIHADNVARAKSDAERARSMGRLRQSLERTANLSAQLLTYSRMQNASEHEQRVPIRLIELVREAAASFEPMRHAKSQRLSLVESAAAEGAWITGEPIKIQRLVLNLLDNASRYAPEGSTISVGVRMQRDHVVLTVSNGGPAIPPGLRDRVFDAYYRVPGSASDGSGLGLAIVKEIAAQHEATVALSAISGDEGTLVCVSFPAASATRSAPTLRAGSAEVTPAN
jgi:two-component system sensor histidine kinase QseC